MPAKMGRLPEPGQVRRPARQNEAFKAFGKKSAVSSNDSPPSLPIATNACIYIQYFVTRSKHRIILRPPAIFIGLLISISVSGQAPAPDDTIRIKEVVVKGYSSISAADGSKHTSIDTAILMEYSLGNLSEIMSENTPVFIKSYGLGGTATTSIRGTGANHTQIAWNGTSINSSMLGQADLSLIPAGFLDNISICTGGASMGINKGEIGGMINVETGPDWKSNGSFGANIGAGSFDRYAGMFKFRSGNKNFQSVTKIYLQSEENDFRFLNNVSGSEPVYERRKNAQVGQISLLQEVYLKREKSLTSARIWYQISDRNLPATMLTQQPGKGESQMDEFFRTALSYGYYGNKADYSISASWFSDRLDYFNPAALIKSINNSNTLITKGEVGYSADGKTRFKFIVNNELNFVKSVNYNNQKKRSVSTFTTSVRRILGEKISIFLLLQEILNDGRLLTPDLSSGFDVRVMDEREYFFRFSLSKNSKIPSLNDLYWNPGGNPDLKNEYCFSGEASWEMKGNIFHNVDYNASLTYFSNNIRDMIQWVPSQSGYWSPFNIGVTRTSGLEAGTTLAIKRNLFSIRFNGQLTLTYAHATKDHEGEYSQGMILVYIPENQFNAGLRISYRNIYSSWITSFTGRRYITADNTQYLPDYLLNDVTTGLMISRGKNSFDINFKINNIFGVNYQAIAYYPMPGRIYMVSFIYQHLKK